MDWFIIPARKGSKGFPGKNRKLFRYTADIIPSERRKQTIVTTDDEMLLSAATLFGFHPFVRQDHLCTDEANVRDVLLDVIRKTQMYQKDIIVMLYLTYPERSWKQVVQAHKFFKDNRAKSLLCREELSDSEVHPYCWFYDNKNIYGRQIVEHDLYRRQDYPQMFKASHFIFMAYADEIEKLNKNLWNRNTVFFPISNTVDVDNVKDFEVFQGGVNGNK